MMLRLALALVSSALACTAIAQTPPAAQAPATAAAKPDDPVREQVIVERRQEETLVAIPPFATPESVSTAAGNTATLGTQIAGIISSNLSGSGLYRTLGPGGLPAITMPQVTSPAFAEWSGRGAENLIQGFVRANPDNTLTVGCYLYDVDLKTELVRQGFVVGPREWRRAAHKCADAIYSRLSGESPFFDSRIAYIVETGPKDRRVKQLAIMDSDGANHRIINNGPLVLTPRWSPDYKEILYLSYANKRPRIYIYNMAAGKSRLVTESPNQTFSPRWSPDGQSILYSMVVGGNTDIFRVSAEGGEPQRLTSDPGIETGGSYSPDGKRIVFESDRSGAQQIYVMSADGTNPQRISFGGGQHATPEWSPRGDLIAFTKIGGGQFRVGVMTPSGNSERILTNSWQDEAPTWAPNGRVIQFFRTSQGSGKSQVWQVDVAGRRERRIQTPYDGSDPAWGPLLP